MNRYLAQRKSRLMTIASGLIMLVVIGLGLFRESPATSAATTATATAFNLAHGYATAHAYETWDRATWIAYAPDKVTQEAILELTSTRVRRPTPTWFDKIATEDSLLTTSPTPWPTFPPPTFIQRPAGAGRLIGDTRGICGNQCYALNYWIEKTTDKFIVVTAAEQSDGYSGHTKAQVIVEWWSVNDRIDRTPPRGARVFPVPIPAESVLIVDALGEQLMLRIEDGTLLFFDVPSRQYISVPSPQLTVRRQHSASEGIIVEKSDVPFAQPGFSALNQWSGKNSKGQISLFAGADDKINNNLNLGKGVLAVVTSKGEPGAADTPQVYSFPETDLLGPRGALWIFDVKGNQVALMDQNGTAFFFDLATRQFTSGLDEQMTRVFGAPLFDPNMPVSEATPQPVTPFVPTLSTPVSTPVLNAYPS